MIAEPSFGINNFCFCNFQFHSLIIENQIGALTMDIIELEIKRTDHRTKEEGLTPSELAQKALDSRAKITVLTVRSLAYLHTCTLLHTSGLDL